MKKEKQCKKHSKQIEAYCLEDNELLCVSCIIENDNHRSHKIVSIDRAVQIKTETINHEIESVNHLSKPIDDLLSEIDTRIKINNDNYQEDNMKNNNFYIQMFDEINKVKNENEKKLSNLFTYTNSSLKYIFDKIKKQKENFINLDKTKQFLQDANQQQNEFDILKHSSSIYELILQIKSFNESEYRKQLNEIKGDSYTINKIEEINKIIDKLNCFKSKHEKIKKQNEMRITTQIRSIDLSSKGNESTFNFVNSDSARHKSKNDIKKHHELFPVFKYTANSPPIIHKSNTSQIKPQKTNSSTNSNKSNGIDTYEQISNIMPKYKSVSQNAIQPIVIQNELKNNEDTFLSSSSLLSVTKTDFIPMNNSEFASLLYKEINCSVYLLGGKSDTLTRKYSIDSNSWTKTDFSIEQSDFVAILYKDKKALAMGGKASHGILSDTVALINFETGTIDKLDFKLKQPKCGFGGAFVLGKIFICGGTNANNVLDTFEYFDVKKKRWKDLPKMNKKRKDFSCLSTPDNSIYVIGGVDEKDAVLRNVERFDIIKNTWIKVKEMNMKRKGSVAICMPEGIYVLGGFDGVQYLKSIEKYDFVSKSWIYLKDMTYSKCYFGASPSADYRFIFTFGGYNGRPLNVVERYDVIENKWEILSDMPSAKYKHQCLFVKE